MADNKVSFEISANTKPAGKALLDLSKLINKAVTVDVTGQEKSIIKQQKEYKKLATEVNKAFTEINKLNKADKDAGVKAGLPFNQYLANEKKIETLKNQLENTTDLKERKQLNADIAKYKSVNARMDDYAKQVLRQILGTEKSIVSDEQSIFGIKTNQAAQTKKVSDDTKKTADNETELNKKVKETSAGFEEQAKSTKDAGDAFNKTTKEEADAHAKRVEEARASLKSLSSEIDSILSRNFSGPDRFTFADFTSAKQDLAELKDAIETLGIPEEFKDDYNKIVAALAKIAAGERMLKKEAAEVKKTPILPTEQIEDGAAKAEQKLHDVANLVNKVLAQPMLTASKSMADLKVRLDELSGAKKAIESIGVPKELHEQYNQLKLEIISTNATMRELEKAGVKSTDEQANSLAKVVEQYNKLYLLKDKGQLDTKGWEELTKVKEKIQDFLSIDLSDEYAVPADMLVGIKEYETALSKITELYRSGNLAEETRSLSTSLFKALEKVKIAYAEAKREIREPLPSDKVKEFQTAMQGVLDTTDKVSQKMRFDTDTVGIAELIRRLHDLQQAKKVLEDFGLPREMDARYSQLLQLIDQTKAKLNEEKKKMQEVGEASTKAGKDGDTAHQKIKSSASKTISPLKRMASEAKIIKSGFTGLSKTSDKLKSSFDRMASSMRSNFKHLITNITKYVLGFRSLFFLVRRLRKYVGEGIKNLASFNNGSNIVNESITDMLSSLLFLKNAWAAAFSPIISFVRPILVSLIDSLAEVGNAVARFLSFILGQEIAFNAVRVSAEDYADVLDDVGDSAGDAADKAKKLTDRLAAFDDLNVLGKDNDNDGRGSGGGGGSADKYVPDPNEMFTIVDPEKNGLLEALKLSWENADFSWLGELIKNKLLDGLKNINANWDEAQDFGDRLAKSFGSFLQGLFGDPELYNEVALTVSGGLNTITSAISSFLEETKDIDFGGNIAEGLNTFLENTDFSGIADNINEVITQFDTNINSFIDTLDNEQLAQSISDFIDGLDIPQLLENAGKTTIKLVCSFIDISSDVIMDLSDRIAEDLVIQVTKPIETGITYTDAEGNEQHLSIKTEIDWTENPISALLDSILLKIGEFWVTEIAGFDTFEKVDNLLTTWNEWFGKYFNGNTNNNDGPSVAGGGRKGEGAHTHGSGGVQADFEEYGTYLLQGLKNGFDFTDADNWVREHIFNPILTALGLEFLISSPSKVMEEQGGYIGEGLKNGIEGWIPDIEQIFSDFYDWLSGKWDEIKGNTYQKWVEIKTNVTTKIQELKDNAVEKFENLKTKLVEKWQEIKGSIYEKLVGIKSNIIGVFEQVKDGVKHPINQFIDVIEGMVNHIIDGINYLFDKVNSITGLGNEITSALGWPNIGTIGHLNYVTIPHLAQGAVIPPNKEFMAVLGDQSHGTNIEAPLDTIKQAVAEVLGNNNNQEVIDLLQQLIQVVESKNLTIGDKEIGKANNRFTNRQRMIRGTSF